MKPNVIKWIITICLYLVLVAPFLVWGKFLFPYITPKTLFFRILIEIALFFYIILIIYRPEYRPRFSKLTWAVLIYLLIMTFASIFGIDAYRSFWGNIERGEGLLTIYHLFIFFILITSIFKEKKEWFRFFNVSIFVSLFISFYALAQKLGQESFLWFKILPSAGGARLTGTIGNASFLAAYLLLSIFLCLFLFVNRRQIGWRIFYSSAFLFETYILFQTETRGALLGFLGGLLLIAILSAVFSKNKKVKLGFVGLFLILIILAASVWVCREQAWVSNTSVLHRLTTISTTDITTQSRLLSWQAGWKGWQDRFLFGYGYENYNVAFNKYFPVPIYRDPGSQIWFDRAHNVVFDQAVTGGIFGILAYLSIFGLAIWFLWIKRHHYGISVFILFGLLVGYFAQNFFVFDTLGTYILFYSVLGFIAYLSFSKEGIPEKVVEKGVSQPRPFLIIVLALILIWSVYIFNIKPAIANTVSVKGLSYAYNNMYREAMVELKKSLNYKTYQAPEIRQNLVSTVSNASKSGQFSQKENKENFDFAIEEIEKNLAMAPLNARHYMFAMRLYNTAARFDISYYDKVIQLGQKALSLSPTRPQIYYIMGQAAMSQGKAQEGIDYFRKAVELNPSVLESNWILLTAYILLNQDDLAVEQFSYMETIGLKYSFNDIQRLINIYSATKDFQKIAVLYEEMIKINPNSANLYAKLAATYKEIGEIEKARQAVQKAVELDPSFEEEAKIFLESLK